jgi:hypothetical protein
VNAVQLRLDMQTYCLNVVAEFRKKHVIICEARAILFDYAAFHSSVLAFLQWYRNSGHLFGQSPAVQCHHERLR